MAIIEQELERSKLSVTIRDLLDTIGMEATSTLLEWRGGRQVYIPKDPKPGHPIVLALGSDITARLVARYQLCVLDLPMTASLKRVQRDQIIRERRQRGESTSMLAGEFNLTIRQIRNICQEA